MKVLKPGDSVTVNQGFSEEHCRGCGNRIICLSGGGVVAQGYYDMGVIAEEWGVFVNYPDLESDGGDGGRCDGSNPNCVVNRIMQRR